MILFVCAGVMYSGEYGFVVLLSESASTQGKLKSLPDQGGNRTLLSQRSRVRFPPWSGKLFSLPGVDAHSE